MFRVFRETTGWILRYSGWRWFVPAIFFSFFAWITAEVIFWLDQRKEKRLCKAYWKKKLS